MFLHKTIAIQGNSLYLLYTEWLDELLTISIVFTGVANTTSTPTGQLGSHKDNDINVINGGSNDKD